MFLFFLSNCHQTFLWTGPISFLVIYKLFCSVLSDGMLTLLLSFVFQNGHKTDTCFLNIGISHQSSASFFTPLSCLLRKLSFRSYTIFLKNTWVFLRFSKIIFGFFYLLDLVDNYAKIVDERGRNLMCDRTLPSLLVEYYEYYIPQLKIIISRQSTLY